MQTFLPFSDFEESFRVLDRTRLGNQRREARQIIDLLLSRPLASGAKRTGWLHHPAVLMWRGHVDALKLYYNLCISEWVRQGYRNSMERERIRRAVILPPWLGQEAVHSSHRAALLFKDLAWYSQWGWDEKPQLQYVWPVLNDV